jgi:hypothetical protein
MENVLDHATTADVVGSPFPHLIVRNAVSPDLCAHLTREFPTVGAVAQSDTWRSNQRFSLPSRFSLGNPHISPLWQEFIREHISRRFLGRMFDVLGSEIVRRYPQWAADAGALHAKRHGQREVDDFSNNDVLLDALPSMNTPVSGKPTSVRTGHVDDPRKLVAGLFYLRRSEDDSRGGDLVLYRHRKPGHGKFEHQMIDDRYIEPVATVPYASNVLVLFLNSIDSVHGVTPRHETKHDRIFMNLIVDTERPLFDLASRQYPKWRLRARRLKRRIFGAPAGFYK